MAGTHPSKVTHLDGSLDHQEPSEALHNNAFGNFLYIPEEILSTTSY